MKTDGALKSPGSHLITAENWVSNKNTDIHFEQKKKNIRAVDKHNTTNHAESSSDMHQSQAHTLPKRPSLVTGARTDKFGLSF